MALFGMFAIICFSTTFPVGHDIRFFTAYQHIGPIGTFQSLTTKTRVPKCEYTKVRWG